MALASLVAANDGFIIGFIMSMTEQRNHGQKGKKKVLRVRFSECATLLLHYPHLTTLLDSRGRKPAEKSTKFLSPGYQLHQTAQGLPGEGVSRERTG